MEVIKDRKNFGKTGRDMAKNAEAISGVVQRAIKAK